MAKKKFQYKTAFRRFQSYNPSVEQKFEVTFGSNLDFDGYMSEKQLENFERAAWEALWEQYPESKNATYSGFNWSSVMTTGSFEKINK